MVAKVLGPKSLDEIFPKETTKQNKTKEGGIWEEEALEECTNVARKKTHTHTHHPTKGSKQSSSTDSTGAGLLALKYEAKMCSSFSVI
jgi:hypothetical protein